MCTELYRGQALQQASTPALIPHEVIVPQSLSFSNHLNNEQLALWLQNHPRLIGNDYQEDINKLKGTVHTLQYYVVQHIKFELL